MKEGWKYKRLGEICDFQNGFAFKSSLFEQSGEPIIRISDIQNGVINDKKVVYFNPDSYKENLSRFKVYPNDILIAMSGATTGKVGINKTKTTFYLNQRVGVFRENSKILDHYFLLYFLIAKSEEGLKLAIGAAQPNLSTEQIKNYSIPVPSLAEQQQIVSFLDSEFEKIDALKANAEEQLQAAKDLFQKALKEMLTPKEGWEEKKLGDICTIKGGKRVPKGYKLESEPTKHVYIRVADFNNNGSVDVNNLLYINDEVYEQIKRYTISEEDVYISIAGTIGKAGIIPSNLNGANLTENACKLVLNGLVDKKYIYFYTLHPTFKQQVMRSTKIGAQPKLALTRLADVVVCFPKNKETQLKVVLLLERLQESIKQLQDNYNETIILCNDLKQSLLKRIFE